MRRAARSQMGSWNANARAVVVQEAWTGRPRPGTGQGARSRRPVFRVQPLGRALGAICGVLRFRNLQTKCIPRKFSLAFGRPAGVKYRPVAARKAAPAQGSRRTARAAREKPPAEADAPTRSLESESHCTIQ